jgi:hypothetical protein
MGGGDGACLGDCNPVVSFYILVTLQAVAKQGTDSRTETLLSFARVVVNDRSDDPLPFHKTVHMGRTCV